MQTVSRRLEIRNTDKERKQNLKSHHTQTFRTSRTLNLLFPSTVDLNVIHLKGTILDLNTKDRILPGLMVEGRKNASNQLRHNATMTGACRAQEHAGGNEGEEGVCEYFLEKKPSELGF